MCDICYGYIYDTIIDPLPVTHILHKHIHIHRVKQCAEEIAMCFQKAIHTFKHYEMFFNLIEYHILLHYTDEDRPEILTCLKDATCWKHFSELYPEGAKEIKYAIDICMDHSITKNTLVKENTIQTFLSYILYIILSSIPKIHKEHTEKNNLQTHPSLGPVPLKQITEIREKLGLPVSNWERTVAEENEKKSFNYE